jgi:ATP-dependent Clp protease, protease subunit
MNNDYLIPMVIEQTNRGERSYDIYSRLLKDRLIFINSEIEIEMSGIIVSEILFLLNEDAYMPIKIYINSPGGSVSAGMAIYDTIQLAKKTCTVQTVCVGLCASMGAILLGSGTKGERLAQEHSEIMIHQLSSGVKGKGSDIQIAARQCERTHQMLVEILAKDCGRTTKQVEKEIKDDYYMNAEEAKKYGIIDNVT